MSGALEFSSYKFQGSDELCLKAGANFPTQILLIPPLFEEMNRMRQMLCDTMRLLAERNIGSVLVDLPGTNESLFPQETASLSIWRDAVQRCLSETGNISHIASFRGGCLVTPNNFNHWQLSPAKGSSILRSMMRTRIASDKESGITTTIRALEEQAQSAPIILAGNILSPAMVAELETAVTSEKSDHTARLQNDSQPAEVYLPGSPLWLRAEPDSDPVLAEAIADDLAAWVAS